MKSNLAREPESLSYRLESTPGSHVAHVVWTGASVARAAGLLRVNLDGDGEETDARTTAEKVASPTTSSITAARPRRPT